jgi:hypothetical protein
MLRVLIAIIVVGGLLIGFLLYRSRSPDLQVDPHAREVIEKAKQR